MAAILLAEDDDVMRRYLARALERAGHDVVPVDCGAAAMARVDAGENFDLLLTDIVMPQIDGVELAQRVAALRPDIRVIFITGFSAVALRAEKALPEGRIISKPFHLKDLVCEVQRVLGQEPFVPQQS